MKRILFSLFIGIFLCMPLPTLSMGVHGQNQDPQQRECHYCFDEQHPVNEFIRLACGHQNTCREGLLELVQRAIRPGEPQIDLLQCPAAGCHHEFTEVELRQIVAGLDWQQRDNIINNVRQLRRAQQGLIRHCPTPDCDQRYNRDPNQRELHHCDGCNQLYCTDCGENHDIARRCVEIQIEQALQNNENPHLTQQCPNCNVAAQKDYNSCEFVTCDQCNTHFCWFCRQVGADHFRHRCIYVAPHHLNDRNVGWRFNHDNPQVAPDWWQQADQHGGGNMPQENPIHQPAMSNLWEEPIDWREFAAPIVQPPARQNWWEDFPVIEEPVQPHRPAVHNFNRPLNRHNQWGQRAQRQQNRFQARRNNNHALEKSLVIMAGVATVALVITQWRWIKQKAINFKNWVGNKFSRNKKVIEQKNGHEVIVQ